ncbi:MAG: hypothetical protein ABI333_06890 [bacterium]
MASSPIGPQRQAAPGGAVRAVILAATTAVMLVSFPRAARAQRTCLPQGPAGTTYLCDSLEGAAQPSTDVVGGTFLADGWQVDGYNNRLLFDPGAPMVAGALRFYFRGVSETTLHEVGTGSSVHRHLMELWDDGGPIGIGGAAYAMKIRSWGDSATEQPGNFGRLRFSMTSFSEAMMLDCGEENWFNNDRIASGWAGGWIRVDIEFGAGLAQITLVEEGTANSWTRTVTYADCAPGTAVLRYLYLPLEPTNNTGLADSVRNSVYSWVSFVGTPATCFDPCDDGNPCTLGQYGDAQFTHYCAAGQCTADPVPDGSPCPGGACQSGVCDTGDPPDAGPLDAGGPDAGPPDGAAGQDASPPDANLGDAGGDPLPTTSGGCHCATADSAGGPAMPGGLFLLLWLLLRRRSARLGPPNRSPL